MAKQKAPLRASDIELQLAEARTEAFDAAGWVFELKLDGFRLLVERIGGTVSLFYRRGRDATLMFPEIAQAVGELAPGHDFILDCELVIADERGHPIFSRLLKRSNLASPKERAAGAAADPAILYTFDLLMLDGVDLRARALRERKELLHQLLQAPPDRVKLLDHVEGQGVALLEVVRQQGLEGIVAKRLDSTYRGGRQESWLKVALKSVGDFAVCGYATDWGSLALCVRVGDEWVAAGSVGSGFTPAIAKTVEKELSSQRIPTCACSGAIPSDRDFAWVEPTMVVEVRYKQWPDGLSVREPTFLRFRDDKRASECTPPENTWLAKRARASAVTSAEDDSTSPHLTNKNKIYFPKEGITKGDLFAYYRDIAPWMLPYLRDRAILLTRYPDGIHGKSFFQKALPARAPQFVKTVRMRNDEENRDIDQILCGDQVTLEWCATLGTIPIHIPASRVNDHARADWANVDFDPKATAFEHVIVLANTLRSICEQIGLPSYVKTSGSSGLHVLIPLGGQLDHTGARHLAEALSVLVIRQHPQLATTDRSMKDRVGKVYLDCGQNGQGRVLVAPYAVRPKEGAPMSMPIAWDQVKPGLTPTRFTIRDAVKWLEKNGDPLLPILTEAPDLAKAFDVMQHLLRE